MASQATEMLEPCSAQRRPAPPSALRRADPTRPLCVRVLDSTDVSVNSFYLRHVRKSKAPFVFFRVEFSGFIRVFGLILIELRDLFRGLFRVPRLLFSEKAG